MPGAAERAFGTQVDQIHAANNIDVLLPISHQPARRLLSGLQAFFNGETPSSDQLPRRACAVPLRRMDSPVVLTVNDLDETRGATSPAEWSASRRNSALSIICFGDTETQTRLEKSGIPVLSLFPDGDLAGGAIIFDVPRIGVLAGEYFTQNGYVFFAFVGDLTRRSSFRRLMPRWAAVILTLTPRPAFSRIYSSATGTCPGAPIRKLEDALGKSGPGGTIWLIHLLTSVGPTPSKIISPKRRPTSLKSRSMLDRAGWHH